VRAFLLLVLLFMGSVAQAQLTIQISRGADNPTRIAVSPMGTQGGLRLTEDISQIISDDLEFTGQFAAIPRRDMLSFPQTDAEVHFRDWNAIKAEYLLIGTVEQRNGIYYVSYQLFDVVGQRKPLPRITEQGGEHELRDIAHRIANRVYENITGIPGIFTTKIIYVEASKRGTRDHYRLMLADFDGARPVMLRESSEPLLSPVWSPDGRRVAYVSFETTRPAIYIQELATGRREQITNFRGLNGAPAWSPDGRKMAMTLSKDGNPEIYVMDLVTRQLTRMTNHFMIDHEPSWSMDGNSIFFTSDRGGRPQIYKVNVATLQVERVTFDGEYNARGRVSPDGNSLVTVHRNGGNYMIAVLDLKTGRTRPLTEADLDESPSIAPNGAMLMYATRSGGKGILGAVSLDARTRVSLPSKLGDVREPAWSPFFK
jgi:TolB protein